LTLPLPLFNGDSAQSRLHQPLPMPLLSGDPASTGPAAPPTSGAQAVLLDTLRRRLEPIMLAEHVPPDFVVKPGVRLRRTYGHCAWIAGGGPPLVTVRCTADGDRTQWRRTGAIVGTLLHEVAHVR